MKTFIKYGMLLSSLLLGNQAFAAHSCTFTASNTAGTSFQLDVSVTNTGTTALTSWTVTFTFPEQVTITNQWNVGTRTGTNPGTSFQFTNCCSWQLPAPGATLSNVFGFQGTHDGSFMAPTCTGSGSSTTTTSSSSSSSSSST